MADILASVSVVVGAELSAFKAGMAAAKRELRGLVQAGEAMKDIGKTLTLAVTAPLAALGLTTVKVGGDFQAAFNRVEAATQASGAELESLKKKAQGIALDPKLQFSSVQAAQALENLAKNGLTTTQILGGAADASANLATATGGQLTTAADITTDVMNNFGKSAAEAAKLVSNITGTTIASKLSIDEYRQALGQAGGVAGQLGVKFEDMNAALAVTSSGFSSGSDAGTSFKTFLQRLVPQSKEAAAAMEKLGLKFFDAQGKMKPLREIAGELQQAFKGLSDQQKNQLGTQIFGSDSIRTALLLAKDGAAGFDEMAKSIGKVDAAAQGSILNKGFVGAKEAFKSAFEGFQVALAESGILDFGTKLAKMGAEVLSSLAQLNPEILRTGAVVATLAAATGPLLFGLGTLLTMLPAIKAGFLLMTGPIGLTVAAIVGAAALIIANWDEIVAYFTTGEGGQVFKELARSVKESISAITAAFESLSSSDITTLGGLISSLDLVKTAFRDVATGITGFLDLINGLVKTVSSLLNGEWAQAWDGAKQAVAGLYAPLANLLGLDLTSFREMLGLGTKPQGTGLSDYFLGLTNNAFKTEQAVGEVLVTAEKLGTTTVKPLLSDADTKAAEEMAKALDKVRDSLTQIDNEVKAGINFDPLNDKIKVLSSGIPTLLAAGFAPNGKVVTAFVSQLTGLEAEYEKFAARIAARQIEDGDTGKVRLDNPLKLNTTLPKTLAVDNSYAEKAKEAAATYQAAIASLQPAQLAAIQSQIDFNTGMSGLLEQMNAAVAPLLADVGLQFATAFGDIVTGVSSAGDAFKGLFSGILQSIAGFMGTFGKQLIAIGIGKLGLDKLFASGPAGGPAAIAAGIGLVALAGVAGSVAKSSAASLGKITGGGSLAPPAPRSLAPTVSRAAALPAQGQAALEKTIRMVLDISPSQFRAMGQFSTDKFGRVVGG